MVLYNGVNKDDDWTVGCVLIERQLDLQKRLVSLKVELLWGERQNRRPRPVTTASEWKSMMKDQIYAEMENLPNYKLF